MPRVIRLLSFALSFALSRSIDCLVGRLRTYAPVAVCVCVCDYVDTTVCVVCRVQAAEDLVLTGKERSIVRVSANNMYSCLMQKTQRFSSLFRHYSKHHGLPRESLDFFFTVRNMSKKKRAGDEREWGCNVSFL